MSRVASPHWHAGRGRWYANIGAKGPDGRAREVYAPREIDRRDEAGAWGWFSAEVARQEAMRAARQAARERARLQYGPFRRP